MKRLTTEIFVERARALHGDRYDYSQTVYKDAKTPVTIICKIHGPFQQLPHNHLRGGGGCIPCNKIEGRRLSVTTFLERAKDVHGDKYDYTQVQYVNTKTPVTIICPVHGPFVQSPEKHMAGQGCPKCAPNHKDTKESFIEKARAKHGDFYDYSKVEYVDEHTPVCIIDPEYGPFWQQPNSHLNGRGNPVRRGEKGYRTMKANGHIQSDSENSMYKRLVKIFGEDDVVREYWSKRYPFSCDFYIRSLDLFIELHAYWFHGGHWFDPFNEEDAAKRDKWLARVPKSSMYRHAVVTWTQRDITKRDVALRNNLNYCVFWKVDLSDFEEWCKTLNEDVPVLKHI